MTNPNGSDLRDILKSIEGPKPDKDDLFNRKKENRILKFDDLKVGMEVAFGKPQNTKNEYIYKHHGIVTETDPICRTCEIVELSANSSKSGVSSALSSKCMEPKVGKASIHSTDMKDGCFFYDYQPPFFPNEIIKNRAEILVRLFPRAGVKYHLYHFNCEHLTSYCAAGLAYCGQSFCLETNMDATLKLDDLLEQYVRKTLAGKPLHDIPNRSQEDKGSCLLL